MVQMRLAKAYRGSSWFDVHREPRAACRLPHENGPDIGGLWMDDGRRRRLGYVYMISILYILFRVFESAAHKML